MCVWYTREVFRDPPPVFPLPPPGGARRMLDRIRTFAHTSEVLNGPAAQARRSLLLSVSRGIKALFKRSPSLLPTQPPKPGKIAT